VRLCASSIIGAAVDAPCLFDSALMIKIYTADNLQDAHLLLGLLGVSGIDARILNASAQGALGEIPFSAAYPEIWLVHARDAERARQVLTTFEQPTLGTRPVICHGCGEENPVSFEICWNCGAATEEGPR